MNYFQNREKITTNCTRFAAFLGISASVFLVAPIGHAGVVVTASEVGGNVVFSGGGTLNLSDLNPVQNGCYIIGFLMPSIGAYQGGGSGSMSEYCNNGYNGSSYGPVTGPFSFGSGSSYAFPDISSGDPGGISMVLGGILVPDNYESGSSIFSTSTYLAETFQSLSLTPGVYEWTWGTTNPDSYKLIIGQPAAVPGPLPLVGAAAAFGVSRRLRKRIAAPLSTPPQA